MNFFVCQYFSFWMPFQNAIFFMGFMVYIIQRQLFISLHQSQSQELPSNREGRFFSSRKYISLWRSKEKRTVTALARRGETLSPRTAPAGARTPCLRGPGCPPARPPASSSTGSSVFTWCIFFRYKYSVCGLVWLAAAGAAAAARKVHDLSI